jgi:hypothetical protein
MKLDEAINAVTMQEIASVPYQNEEIIFGDERAGPPKVPFKVRMAHAGDLNFMLKTWLECTRDMTWGRDAVKPVYYTNQQKLIGTIAARPGCLAVVMVDALDEDQILGFCVAEPAHHGAQGVVPMILHFIYTKQAFRHFGLAREMLRHFGWQINDPIIATNISAQARAKERKLMKAFRVVYNPFVLLLKDWYKGWDG